MSDIDIAENEEPSDSDQDNEEDQFIMKTYVNSIEQIKSRPSPITPSSLTSLSEESDKSTNTHDQTQSLPVVKYLLGSLLTEHKKNEKLEAEMAAIRLELQNNGGFVNMLKEMDAMEASESLTDEQENTLRQFEVRKSALACERPGMIIFNTQKYQCLFDQSLHPIHCGFKPDSNNVVDKYITRLTPDSYQKVFTHNGRLKKWFARTSCQQELLRWLFFMLSIHPDVEGYTFLQEILYNDDNECYWAPNFADIVTVFLNYGAEESILPDGFMTDNLRNSLTTQPDYSASRGNRESAGPGYNKENLEHIVLLLGEVLEATPRDQSCYTGEQLTALLHLLCKASLDTKLNNMCMVCPFQKCVRQLIECYTDTDWRKQRLGVCGLLAGISTHHHDLCSILQLLSHTQRGYYLARGTGYLLLKQLLSDEEEQTLDEQISNIEIMHLVQFVSGFSELLESDPYKLYSVVNILEICVGQRDHLNSVEREQLKTLCEKMCKVRVKETISIPDRTVLKNVISRLGIKWGADIDNSKDVQTKLFDFASPKKMNIVKVQADTDSSGSVSDSDEDPIPPKIAKMDSYEDISS